MWVTRWKTLSRQLPKKILTGVLSFVVTISTDAEDQDQADDIFSGINIDFDDSSSNVSVTIDVEHNGNWSGGWLSKIFGGGESNRLSYQIDIDVHSKMGAAYLEGVKTLAEKYDVSIKTLSLSAYLLLLDFLSPQSEVIVGMISNNRLPESGGDKLLGCFLNSVPLRMFVDKKISASDFVRKVDEKMQRLKGNDQMTTMEIARLTGENTTEGNPIFDVIFNYIDFHIYDALHEIGIGTERMLQADLSGVPTFFERTNTYFDLMFNTTGNNLTLKVQLSRKLKAGYDAKAVLYKFLHVLDFLQENGCMDRNLQSFQIEGLVGFHIR